MRIQVSSNVMNGVYSCLELFVVAVLSRCLTTIIGCWNVKRIYVDQKELRLTSSPFKHFADLGLTSRNLQVAGLLTFSLVLGLMTAGGYSVLGVTVPVYKDVVVPNLVRLADEDEIMDLSAHVDMQSSLVSGTVLLLLDYFVCLTRNATGSTTYEYINSLGDITTPKWVAQRTPVFNSTCLTGDIEQEEQEGTDATRYELSYIDQSTDPTSSRIFRQKECKWSVNGTDFPLGTMTQTTGTHSSACPFPLLEAWCLRSEETMHCIAVFQSGDEFITGTLTGTALPNQAYQPGGGVRILRRPTYRQIQSMVVLHAAGLLRAPAELEFMTRLVVKNGAGIRELVESRDITELNVLLFGLTAGVALCVTAGACVVAMYLWVTVIYLPGRSAYNRFNSAMDLMNYAASVSLIAEDKRVRRHKAIAVGMRTSDADVGPLENAGRDRVWKARSIDELG